MPSAGRSSASGGLPALDSRDPHSSASLRLEISTVHCFP